MKVVHGDKIRVKARVGDYNIGSHFSFWLDTDSDDPGPEYRIKVVPNSEVYRSAQSRTSPIRQRINRDYRASADELDRNT